MKSKYVPPGILNVKNSLEKNDHSSDGAKERQQYTENEDIGSVMALSGNRKIYSLTIMGQIEGHNRLPEENKSTKYERVLPELVAIEQDPKIEGLLLLLHTVGGDIEAGLAIAELISSMSKPSVSLVIGGGHSIGVPLAVCTDYSFIVPTATMTIHPVRTDGTTVGVAQSFEQLQKMQSRIASFVVNHSKISEKKFYELCMNTEEMAMDVGTVIDGNQAVKNGLINEVGGLANAIDKLHELTGDAKKKRKNK